MKLTTCPECGAELSAGRACKDYFNELITWDFEDFAGAGSVHHMTVLCYYLQHPSFYSPKGLADAKQILTHIIEDRMTAEQVARRNKQYLSSRTRNWNINSSPAGYATYAHPITWTRNVRDVLLGGPTDYPSRVQEWIQSIYADLKKTHNI